MSPATPAGLDPDTAALAWNEAMSPLRPKPSSPCTKLCVLDAVTGLCEGCGRTRDEIALWGGMSEPQRRAVMTTLEHRLRTAYPLRSREPAT